MGLSFLSLMAYGLLAHAARDWFAVEGRSAWFNRISGSLFLALGIGMLRLKAART